MTLEREKLYSNPEDFFSLNGHAVMQLTPESAIEVCQLATGRGIMVWRVEGGIWHNPGFEARLDCIWDWCPTRERTLVEANQAAENFIREESEAHDVFILSIRK